VPIAIRKRGGRKLIIAPDGRPAEASVAARRVDDALVKAIARAFRWQRLLENGTYATIAEIAKVEKINETYVGRVLRLALLKPQMIEAISNGAVPRMRLDDLMKCFPVDWTDQASHFGSNGVVGHR
jgi:hypothetical protein